jgi:hypothetical protein
MHRGRIVGKEQCKDGAREYLSAHDRKDPDGYPCSMVGFHDILTPSTNAFPSPETLPWTVSVSPSQRAPRRSLSQLRGARED